MTSTTAVSIYYSIKDLVHQDEWDSINEEFSCPICCEFIFKQEWYQCINGHPSCGSCWNRVIANNSSKQCPSCRAPVKSLTNGLSRCRYIEQSFANKKVACPYSFKDNIKDNRKNKKLVQDNENGCKEIITVEQLDDHQAHCNSRFVKFNNKGCNKISRYNQHQQQHQNQCAHAIIQCELCEASIKRSSLSNHKKSCPSRIIVCNQCPLELKKSDLADHIDNECPNSIIRCRYQEYGCNTQFKRSETSNHLQQVNHTEFMMKQIDQQAQQLNQQSQQLNQQSLQLVENIYSIKKMTISSELMMGLIGKLTQKLNQQSQELESCKEELESSNDKCNYILDKFKIVKLKLNNIVSYSNIWIISNFINKTGKGKPSIYTSIMNISLYQFQISTEFKDGYQYYYLYIMGSKNGKVKVKYSFKLLNCKDISKSLTRIYERDIDINGDGWGGGFSTAEYSKASGYIFPDDSVHIKFTIDIAKAALQS